MSRQDRFGNLERRRPDRDGGDRGGDEPAGSSRRFQHIEPRREQPAAPAPDPFAPPPEAEDVPLEVREDDRREAKQMHAARDVRANAELEATALIRDHGAPLRPRRRSGAPILDRRQTAVVAIGGVSAIALLAAFVGSGAWVLVSVLVVVLIPLALPRGDD